MAPKGGPSLALQLAELDSAWRLRIALDRWPKRTGSAPPCAGVGHKLFLLAQRADAAGDDLRTHERVLPEALGVGRSGVVRADWATASTVPEKQTKDAAMACAATASPGCSLAARRVAAHWHRDGRCGPNNREHHRRSEMDGGDAPIATRRGGDWLAARARWCARSRVRTAVRR